MHPQTQPNSSTSRWRQCYTNFVDTKKDIRSTVLQRRDTLPARARADKSAKVCREVERRVAEAFDRPCIAVFKAMRSEVDLSNLAASAYEQEWDVCFPCMVRDRLSDAEEPSRMAFYRVPAERYEEAVETLIAHPLRCRSCSTLAASGYASVEPRELDVVAVPLVAFDDAGNRLGYGGGNYDRLLPALRPDALVMGVAFEEQRVDAVPCEPHDQPLPCIVSA